MVLAWAISHCSFVIVYVIKYRQVDLHNMVKRNPKWVYTLLLQNHPQGIMERKFHELTYTAKVN